jgi:hypothetical protein
MAAVCQQHRPLLLQHLSQHLHLWARKKQQQQQQHQQQLTGSTLTCPSAI